MKVLLPSARSAAYKQLNAENLREDEMKGGT